MNEPIRKHIAKQGRHTWPRRVTAMSQRELDAYLLTKDVLRRVQRAASLIEGAATARTRPPAF